MSNQNIPNPIGMPSNSSNQKYKDIEVIIKNLEILEGEPSPNWEGIIALQRKLIQLLSKTLTDQKGSLKAVQNKVNKMNQRLQSNTIPYSDMEKVANILKPFLAKTLQENKTQLNLPLTP
jgi:hypothetical protein